MSSNYRPMNKTFQRVLSVVLSVAMLCALLPCAPALAEEERPRWQDTIDEMLAAGNYIEGEVIVGLRGNEEGVLRATPDLPADDIELLMEVSAEAAGISQPTGLLAAIPQEPVTLSAIHSDTMSTEELLHSLEDDARIVFAEPNYTMELDDADSDSSALAATSGETFEASDAALAAAPPTEIADLTPLQWSNWDTKDFGVHPSHITSNNSINVPNFGKIGEDSNMDEEIVVAVLDQPIDFTNPDLEGRAFTFTPDQQRALGCDEHGFNAASAYNGGSSKLHYLEGSSHGTHCAGILGAEWDGKGISGVASNARFISLQISDEVPYSGPSDTCLRYALYALAFIDRANELGAGIRITSNSWGLYQSGRAFDAALRQLGDKWGIVSLFAAGNDARNNNISNVMNSYAANNPYVIVVASSTLNGDLASYTNFGDATVDFAAPGSSILSSVQECDGTYIPAALTGNILYESFEGAQSCLQVQQIDTEGNLIDGTQGTVTSDSHFMGEHGLDVPIDLSYATKIANLSKVRLRFDFDIEAAQAQTGIDVVQELSNTSELYFGAGVGTPKKNPSAYFSSAKTNMTGDQVISFDPLHYGYIDEPMSNAAFPIPVEALDLTSLDGHVIADVEVSLVRVVPNEPYGSLCIDAVGFGTTKVPYVYKDGTSMACPAAAGVATVLAAQSDLRGVELAKLVRSYTRTPQSGPLPLKTGGFIDFAAASKDAEPALVPTIESLELAGSTLTLRGSNLGSEPGELELVRMVVGNAEEPLSAKLTSWKDDTVVLELEKPFTGIMGVKLTNAAGKRDLYYQFMSKSANIFEKDLPIDANVGNPFEYDTPGDWETKGPLVGFDNKLYYFPAEQGYEAQPMYYVARCFDTKTETWSELPSLPEQLFGASAVMYDGKIVVEGSISTETMPTSALSASDDGVERVYVYDPATGEWTRASNEGMFVGQTLVSDDGKLRLVGGMMTAASSHPIMEYDLETGAGEALYEVNQVLIDPVAVVKDGVYFIYFPYLQTMYRVSDQGFEDLTSELPAYVPASENEVLIFGQKPLDPFLTAAQLCVISDGIVFTGYPSNDGASDTFILRDGSSTFEPYTKRATDARFFSSAACSYRGQLYVLGLSYLEPNGRFFRTTAMDVPEYPGDIPAVDPEPTPTPEPEPTPEPAPTPESDSTPASDQPREAASAPKAVETHESATAAALPNTADQVVLWAGVLAVLGAILGCVVVLKMLK